MKIVINGCFGGFSLSDEAVEKYGLDDSRDIDRTDARLIQAVEEMGDAANGRYAELGVAEIPDEATDYYIEEYDGAESLLYVLNGKICWWNWDEWYGKED